MLKCQQLKNLLFGYIFYSDGKLDLLTLTEVMPHKTIYTADSLIQTLGELAYGCSRKTGSCGAVTEGVDDWQARNTKLRY